MSYIPRFVHNGRPFRKFKHVFIGHVVFARSLDHAAVTTFIVAQASVRPTNEKGQG